MSENWREQFDVASNKVYYYNVLTLETSWEAPSYQPSFNNENDDNSNTVIDTLAVEDIRDDIQKHTQEQYQQQQDEEITENIAMSPMDSEKSNWTWNLDEGSNMYYYINLTTMQTQWERPSCFDDDDTTTTTTDNINENNNNNNFVVSVDATTNEDNTQVNIADENANPDNWTSLYDEATGMYYYCNAINNTTQWDRPSCLDMNTSVKDRRNSRRSIRSKTGNTEKIDDKNTNVVHSLPHNLPFSSATLLKLQSLSNNLSEASNDVKNIISLPSARLMKEHNSIPFFDSILLLKLLSKPPKANTNTSDTAASTIITNNSTTSTLAITFNSPIDQIVLHYSNDYNYSSNSNNNTSGYQNKPCTLEEYGRVYFHGSGRGDVISKKVLMSKLTWSPSMITEPLCCFYPPNDESDYFYQYKQSCITLFRHITAYMGDRKSKKSLHHHCSMIINTVLLTINSNRHSNSSSLRNTSTYSNINHNAIHILDDHTDCVNTTYAIVDELYCQICKQIHKNPAAASILSGWNLLLLCLSSFPPSIQLQPCVSRFIADYYKLAIAAPDSINNSILHNNNSIRTQMSKITELALRQSMKSCYYNTYRVETPSIVEVEHVLHGMPVPVTIALLGNRSVSLTIDSWTTVAACNAMVADKLNISKEHAHAFSMYENISRTSRSGSSSGSSSSSGSGSGSGKRSHNNKLEESMRVVDVLSQLECKASIDDGSSRKAYHMLYKVKVYADHDGSYVYDDDTALDMYYQQAVNDVVTEYYPCSNSDFLLLAAIQAHVIAIDSSRLSEMDDFGIERQQFSIADIITSLLPPSLLSVHDHAKRTSLVSKIGELHQCIREYSSFDAKVAYLDHLKSLCCYGATFYHVETVDNSSSSSHIEGYVPALSVGTSSSNSDLQACLPTKVILAVTPKALVVLKIDAFSIVEEHLLSSIRSAACTHNIFTLSYSDSDGNDDDDAEVQYRYYRTTEAQDILDAYNLNAEL